MTIKLENNYLTQVVLWLDRPIWNTYTLVCKNLATNTLTTTIVDNISPITEQYTLFNLIAVDDVSIPVSNNVLYLPLKGEYEYKLYRGIDNLTSSNIAGSGLLINTTDSDNYIKYDQNNTNIVYNG